MTTIDVEERRREGREASFLVRTYAHLLAAVAAFVLFEAALFGSGLAEPIARAFLSVNWLVVLGGFIVTGWLFRRLAYSVTSKPSQYAGLAGYVLVEGLIFVPLLFLADRHFPGVIEVAATITLLGFGSLSYVVFRTRRDFSFLEPFLTWAGLMALVLIVAACLFGLQLGLWFSVAMVLVAGGAILHDTSAVLFYFEDDQHAAAALELFASVALMFWYLIDIVAGWGD